jgi:hypothetical protein
MSREPLPKGVQAVWVLSENYETGEYRLVQKEVKVTDRIVTVPIHEFFRHRRRIDRTDRSLCRTKHEAINYYTNFLSGHANSLECRVRRLRERIEAVERLAGTLEEE